MNVLELMAKDGCLDAVVASCSKQAGQEGKAAATEAAIYVGTQPAPASEPGHESDQEWLSFDVGFGNDDKATARNTRAVCREQDELVTPRTDLMMPSTVPSLAADGSTTTADHRRSSTDVSATPDWMRGKIS